jgi:hypothetical protein
MGAAFGDLAGDVRPRLLRHRDDGDELRPLRHRALRRRSVPRLATAIGPDDHRRPAVAQDGAVAAPHLRPDAGTQVGDFDGRVRPCGGVFDNYAIVQGSDQVVPIDVYIPGCPPRPEAVIYGIVQLQKKIDASRM